MARLALEIADIFRAHGAAWRRANAGHVSLDFRCGLFPAVRSEFQARPVWSPNQP